MKRILYLFLIATFIVSCGPHRMKCGPRGICGTTNSSPETKNIQNL